MRKWIGFGLLVSLVFGVSSPALALRFLGNFPGIVRGTDYKAGTDTALYVFLDTFPVYAFDGTVERSDNPNDKKYISFGQQWQIEIQAVESFYMLKFFPEAKTAGVGWVSGLAPNKEYKVKIRKITNTQNPQDEINNLTFTFRTGAGNVPLEAIELYPPNGSTGIDVNSEIKIRFNKPIFARGSPSHLYRTSAPGWSIPADSSISDDLQTYRYKPTAALSENTKYSFYVYVRDADMFYHIDEQRFATEFTTATTATFTTIPTIPIFVPPPSPTTTVTTTTTTTTTIPGVPRVTTRFTVRGEVKLRSPTGIETIGTVSISGAKVEAKLIRYEKKRIGAGTMTIPKVIDEQWAYTDANGTAALNLFPNETYDYTVSKEYYNPARGKVSTPRELVNVTLKLK